MCRGVTKTEGGQRKTAKALAWKGIIHLVQNTTGIWEEDGKLMVRHAYEAGMGGREKDSEKGREKRNLRAEKKESILGSTRPQKRV